MLAAKKWTVDIFLDEDETGRTTHAEARLHTGDATSVLGIGRSWRNPHDPDVPEIGDELAAARALSDLAGQLREAVVGDLKAVEEASRGR